MTSKQKESPLIKSLLSAGFTEDYIDEQIKLGNVVLKSVEDEEGEEETDEEKAKREAKEKAEKEATEKMEKSMLSVKGISANDLEKSLTGMATIFKSAIEKRDEAIDELKKSIDELKKETPSFRSQGLQHAAVIEKSVKPVQDEEGKTVLNVYTQRSAVREALSTAIAKESDDSLKKSISSDAMGYLCTAEAEIPQSVAQYLYDKVNVRLVK